MKTTFEIQLTTHELNPKEITGRLLSLKHIWNVEVDQANALVSFEYLDHPVLEMVRKELTDMGYYVINDSHHLNKNLRP